MRLPELKNLAHDLGIKGTSGMRKGDLVAAIQAQRGGSAPQTSSAAQSAPQPTLPQNSTPEQATGQSPEQGGEGRRRRNRSRGGADTRQGTGDAGGQPDTRQAGDNAGQSAGQERPEQERSDQSHSDQSHGDRAHGDQSRSDQSHSDQGNSSQGRADQAHEPGTRDELRDEVGARLAQLGGGRRRRGDNQNQSDDRQQAVASAASTVTEQPQVESNQSSRNRYDDDSMGGGRRNRRRRQRDRQNRRNNRTERLDVEPTVSADDVLQPISGIVDVLDNHAFVRTSGYLPGPNDAYVSLSVVRRYGMRKGDVLTGAVKQAREGERKERYQPLVRVDTINGVDPEESRNRPDFQKLTPLYPQERLRLETTPTNMTGRIIDLMAPIGKGQRGLIVSPPKAGKTMIMQNIANAITTNNPEVHLMVVLVDERPEEVTDFQRTVSGEVIASTFDRPAEDHTLVAEMAIERAKRLVEMGRDVVVLLDGITRLGRAYNLAAPASGRILSGGVDSAALYPPKRFFGAARNIENGGSLTIIATALVETGSKMDEVIFEEFKGTGNMELRLRRDLADKRIFPAIDVDASGTRREELLLGREALAIIWKLRRVLAGLDDQAALEMLLRQLRKTQNNSEFLVLISQTTPGQQ